jgi:UDP-N-acetylglucosamine 2-epimerase (non-hydrolysing)
MGLVSWFIKVYFNSKKILRKEENLKGSLLVILGDTLSTMIGAKLGKKLGMDVAHVEAGYRSFDYFNPFPEEIARVFASRYAILHFAPSRLEYDNLTKAKGEVYNTYYNTIIDSMRFGKEVEVKSNLLPKISNEKYFVFVMHRQENLANKPLVRAVVKKIIDVSKSTKCVMILHTPTEIKLREYNLLEMINDTDTMITTPRVDYFEFMKLFEGCEFVITDGGSNQQELHYMGKPCLLIRKKTEQSEGIGQNAIMYNEDVNMIEDFSLSYEKYKTEGADNSISPSDIIVDVLQEYIEGSGKDRR